MTGTSLPAFNHPGIAPPVDRLNGMMARAAAGDLRAFRALYIALAVPVWHLISDIFPGSDQGPPVFDATFVEAWHRSGSFDPSRHRVEDWITSIALHRAACRLHARDRASPGVAGSTAAADAHIHGELLRLVGRTPTGASDQAAPRDHRDRNPVGPDRGRHLLDPGPGSGGAPVLSHPALP